jgi:hypothetical protein
LGAIYDPNLTCVGKVRPLGDPLCIHGTNLTVVVKVEHYGST